MSAAVAELVTVSAEAAIFLQYPAFKDQFYLRRLHILGGELKLAVWLQRNREKYKARIAPKDIHRLFVYFVRVRVRADFLRLDEDSFRRLWCQRTLTLHIND